MDLPALGQGGGEMDLSLDAPPPPPATDLDLDDEPLATRPPRSTQIPAPPQLSAGPLSDDLNLAMPMRMPSVLGEPDRERVTSDAVTATRGRGAVAPNKISNPADPGGWIRQLLKDNTVSGVFILGPESVELERGGRREAVALGDAELGALVGTLRNLGGDGGADPTAPVIDVVLPGEARLTAVFPPVASRLCASIRRSAIATRSLKELTKNNVVSGDMADVLEACVATRRNVLLAGDGAATHTVLEALAQLIPAKQRVIALGARVSPGDPARPWINVSLLGMNGHAVGTTPAAAATAVRPDYLLVDVTSPQAAAEVVAACACGQQGAIVCLPARSASDALARLEGLASGALGSPDAAKALVTGAFDLVAHVATLADGKVRVLALSEPRLGADRHMAAEALMIFDARAGADGSFRATGTQSQLAGTLSALGRRVAFLT
jgi:Flp pilus assembly CpaF family ATPase